MSPTALSTGLVAVVEDSDDDFLMLERGFRRQTELRLVRFDRAETALDALADDDPPLPQLEVLVVDLTLRGMDGVDLIRRVRSMPGGDEVPICVLSGSERLTDVERAAEAGADRYVVKPSSAHGLRMLPAIVRDVSARRRAGDAPVEQAIGPVIVDDAPLTGPAR